MKRIWIFLLILTFHSCIKNNRYESSQIFSNENWENTDTAFFRTVITDTTAKYNVYLRLRRSINYKYSNLWVNIITDIPDTNYKSSTDVQLTLEDKDGTPTGSRFGNNIEHLILIRENTYLKYGEYRFWLTQKMRDKNLHGILNAGLRIDRI